jgi:hypothetical protein
MRKVHELHWKIEINAPVEKVWWLMLSDIGYRNWTLEFNPKGSWYSGLLEEGQKIKFFGLMDDGTMGGMLSFVKKMEMYKHIYFEHYGWIIKGEEKTSGEDIERWAPSFEKYFFEKVTNNKTVLIIEMESDEQYSDMMSKMWPKALIKLKELCE